MPKVNTKPPVVEEEENTLDENAMAAIEKAEDDDEGEGLSMDSMVDGNSSVALSNDISGSELSVAEPSGPFAFDSNPTFDQSEIDIPRVRLLQPVSDDVTVNGMRAGWFVLGGYDPTESVTFYPIGLLRRRQRIVDQSVACRSADAKIGIGDPGGTCATCPHKEWGPKNPATGKGTPPECTMVYDYLGIDMDKDEVCVFSFQKTGMKASKFLNTLATSKGGFGKFAVKISSRLETSKQGSKYFTPTPTLTLVPKETLHDARMKHFPPDA